MISFGQLIRVLGVSVIHIVILFILAPIIDHAFTPLDKEESNEEILIESITQLLTVSVIWYLIDKFVLHAINKYFNIHKVKMINKVMNIITSIVLIGLQTHLVSKLEYITNEHPFRVTKVF